MNKKKPNKRVAKRVAKSKKPVASRKPVATRKPVASKKPVAKGKKPVAKGRPVASKKAPKATRKAARPRKPPARRARNKPAANRWVAFVAKHGVVLASARGPVPSVAEAVAGEPIIGSWWAHAKGKAIFEALSEIDDSPDIKCLRLVDGKVTFVHRKVWPALVRLGRDGVIASEQLAAVQQEHTPAGDHRNVITPFPDWVDDETAGAADALSAEQARSQLAWAEG